MIVHVQITRSNVYGFGCCCSTVCFSAAVVSISSMTVMPLIWFVDSRVVLCLCVAWVMRLLPMYPRVSNRPVTVVSLCVFPVVCVGVEVTLFVNGSIL